MTWMLPSESESIATILLFAPSSTNCTGSVITTNEPSASGAGIIDTKTDINIKKTSEHDCILLPIGTTSPLQVVSWFNSSYLTATLTCHFRYFRIIVEIISKNFKPILMGQSLSRNYQTHRSLLLRRQICPFWP